MNNEINEGNSTSEHGEGTQTMNESIDRYRPNHRRHIGKRGAMRCKIHECPFADADTLPTYAFVIDSLSEKDKDHIKMFHPLC